MIVGEHKELTPTTRIMVEWFLKWLSFEKKKRDNILIIFETVADIPDNFIKRPGHIDPLDSIELNIGVLEIKLTTLLQHGNYDMELQNLLNMLRIYYIKNLKALIKHIDEDTPHK